MTALWFSRVTLKSESHINAIASLLLPENEDLAKSSPLDPRHKLIWSLFADKPDRQRDFLWRADKQKTFYTLSERPPENDMFDIESKSYEPALQTGDRLHFSLRANPIIRRKIGDEQEVVSKITGIKRVQKKVKKVDAIMERLKPYQAANFKMGDPGKRANMRDQLIREAGVDWLKKQGEQAGFELKQVQCTSYEQHVIPRKNKNKKRSMRFSSVDFEGILEVTDAGKFIEKLSQGFGSAKAYGCGLMMIRRVEGQSHGR